MSDIKQKLGKRIQNLRKIHGYTQDKLSELIDIDVTSLSRIETGRSYPQPDTLQKITDVFKIKLHTLFIFDEFSDTEDYIKGLQDNINIIRKDSQKIKLLYNISCDLI